jgi:hypothetical protein
MFHKASDHSVCKLKPIWIDLTDAEPLSDEERQQPEEEFVAKALEQMRNKAEF